MTLQATGLRVSRLKAVLLDTTIVTTLVAAITFASAFNTVVTDFLLFMLVWFAPWTAIFIVDLALRRGRYDSRALLDIGGGRYWRRGGVHAPAVIAQLAGMAAAAAWIATPVWNGPLADATGGADLSAILGLGVAGLLYLLLARPTVTAEGRAARAERATT